MKTDVKKALAAVALAVGASSGAQACGGAPAVAPSENEMPVVGISETGGLAVTLRGLTATRGEKGQLSIQDASGTTAKCFSLKPDPQKEANFAAIQKVAADICDAKATVKATLDPGSRAITQKDLNNFCLK